MEDNNTNVSQESASQAALFNGNEEGGPLRLVLCDPFVFDGEEVTEINLEGLFDLTAGDVCAIDLRMLAKGYSGLRMDTTRQYAMLVAAKVNHKPWEWLERMKARDSIRLRDMVSTFFYVRG